MFEFSVKGTVAGFNTTADGTKSFVKIQPSAPANGLNRDERPGLLDILVPPSVFKSLAMGAAVLVRGKGTVYTREGKDREGKLRHYTNYRYDAEALEPAKA